MAWTALGHAPETHSPYWRVARAGMRLLILRFAA